MTFYADLFVETESSLFNFTFLCLERYFQSLLKDRIISCNPFLKVTYTTRAHYSKSIILSFRSLRFRELAQVVQYTEREHKLQVVQEDEGISSGSIRNLLSLST